VLAARAQPVKLIWREVPILAVETVTPRVKSFRLQVGWERFRAGQYVDVRLTAEDGYQAQRSYSIASSPETPGAVEIMVERLDDGEVSSFFHEVAQAGDLIEMRGPIGHPFTWGAEDGGPLLLVGGGSGVVPLLSMLRHRATAPEVPAHLVYSARSLDEVIARDELLDRAAREPGFGLTLALTREAASVPGTRSGRIDRALIEEALAQLPAPPAHVFVCGSNRFVGAASDLLLDADVPADRIRTERFGG
jgi:ferredoxin-NADP reductase